jgi:hypothetical protein
MSRNTVVQGLWFYGDLPLMQQLSLASFVAHGHQYHLYTYGHVGSVPEGVIIRDASEILPESAVFRDRDHRGYATFADGFRYRLLAVRGGWWVDTDVVCLRPFDHEDEFVFASEHTQSTNPVAIPNNAVMKAPAGAAFLQYCAGVCDASDPNVLEWAALGPGLMRDAIPRFHLERFIQPPEVFCPVPWFRFQELTRIGANLGIDGGCYTVHLWNAVWGRCDLDRSAAFHPSSAYEQWKTTYLRKPPRRQVPLL